MKMFTKQVNGSLEDVPLIAREKIVFTHNGTPAHLSRVVGNWSKEFFFNG